MKYKLELRLLGGRSINNLRYADDTTLMAESEEELKRLFFGGGLKISLLKDCRRSGVIQIAFDPGNGLCGPQILPFFLKIN